MPGNSTGEKTEKPTPKRKREAREEGKVAKSRELSQAVTLLGSFYVLYFLFKNIMNSFMDKMIELLSFKNITIISTADAYDLLKDNIYFAVKLLTPVMLASAVMGLIINFIQIGPLFTGKSMVPKFSNMDPVKGFKNIFSLKSFVELVKSLLKAFIIAFLGYIYIKNSIPELITMTEQGLHRALVFAGSLIFRICTSVIIFLIILGVADYIYQKWEHKKNLMMTKYEVKQERKEMEGDPLFKQKRREKQRLYSMNRMMAAMEEADVVITNPTHISVALKYDFKETAAPVVVAKGEGYLAQRIKEKARELEIEIVENKLLARAINQSVNTGEEIPSELYQAVAEILSYVYSQDRRF